MNIPKLCLKYLRSNIFPAVLEASLPLPGMCAQALANKQPYPFYIEFFLFFCKSVGLQIFIYCKEDLV